MESSLSSQEFLLMQQFIEDQCGISISKDKAYLIESRLSRFLKESNLKNFNDFHKLLSSRNNQNMIEKVVNEITINETMWFRDSTPWLVLEDVLLPYFIELLRKGRKTRIKIWSVACSTGQEPYSIAMCIDRYLTRRNITDISLHDFEILASDISRTVLEAAQTGKYDDISIMRGLNEEYKAIYFQRQGNSWIISDRIKNAVVFKQINLKQDFSLLGSFDIIFCRYVLIYFSENMKREMLQKIAKAVSHDGALFIGSSELINDYNEIFVTEQYKDGVYYKLKG